eukprot:CAMPEP_0197881390 /NCGR_PEP_ID=MMETSP1439-20131203/8895_1 /TAXON_ID=66791 /ORGANISM="Gonyaulax spinifera, Strain CCMP409" /LENGTH=89 /DNA_ID=CAMNT_0043500997 /DNA_START=70 /DNA_END=336 /DNA_ORIENTATION=+
MDAPRLSTDSSSFCCVGSMSDLKHRSWHHTKLHHVGCPFGGAAHLEPKRASDELDTASSSVACRDHAAEAECTEAVAVPQQSWRAASFW